MPGETALWLIFGTVIAAALAVDLGVLHRRAHAVSFKEAAFWSAAWFSLAAAFAGLIALSSGRERALQFAAGYLLEESLSADNMFVFLVIFHYFGLPPAHQSRVLHWGILGAIVMRFLFIFAGVTLVNTFHWMIYIFGAVVIYTGAKMALTEGAEVRPEHNIALKALRRVMPLAGLEHGQSFFVRLGGVLQATPLFAALLVVEFSDLLFAMDSIPAVIAITTDTFVVYTSNVFAILGLRALFFLLANLMGMFRFMKAGISLILIFVGLKMLGGHFYHVPTGVSLCVIGGILTASIAASLLARRQAELP
ncbi:MAG: TerC family protein [Elusimicrobia bacterium]|nr:TerC family protein [Elusimicrobiota bacterium]